MNEYSVCMYTCMPEDGIRSLYRWFWATMRLLEIELRTSQQEQLVLLTTEVFQPPPTPNLNIFKIFFDIGFHTTVQVGFNFAAILLSEPPKC